MKKIFKPFALFVFVITAVVSCSEYDKAIIYSRTAPVLSADKTSLNYQVDINRAATAIDPSMQFDWTEAKYEGAKTPYKYSLEIPAKYPNPKNLEEIRDTIIFVETFADTITSYKIPRSILRNRILRLNAIKAIDITQTNKINFRLKSVIGDNGPTMYSNNIEFTLNP